MARKRPPVNTKAVKPKAASASHADAELSSDDGMAENEVQPVNSDIGASSAVAMETSIASPLHNVAAPSFPQNYEDIEVEIPPPQEPCMNFDGTGPRLLITEIVNDNFKSYFGKHTLGPFHKNFTAIVGPNGSGKSNVIDSMLFVFGYRSQKIRSKKLSSLIHNSEQHQNVEYCTVEVHFLKIADRGEDEFDVLDGSEITIARTAYRDSSSVYHIDGRRVQFKDVATLLRQNGIDIDHNRFLILQGEVEQIAMMKPKGQADGDEGMLEFLEDIIGSSRFKVPLEQLMAKVEELNELRQEKLNRVKVVEKEKEQLETAKEEALEFLRSENNVTRQKHKLFQVYAADSAKQCDRVTEDTREIRESFEKVNASLNEVKAKLELKRNEMRQAERDHESLEATVEQSRLKFAQMEKDDMKYREDFKQAKAKGKKLVKQLETEKEKLTEAMEQPAKSEKEVDQLKRMVEQLERKAAELEQKYQEGVEMLRGETQPLQVRKEAKEKELLKFQTTVNQAKQKVDIARSEVDLYLSGQTGAQRKLTEMEKSLQQKEEALSNKKKQVAALVKELPLKENERKHIQEELRTVREQEQKLGNELRHERQRVYDAKHAMSTNKGRNQGLDGLLAQKRSGKIPGIFGRLGDLGAIDEMYDVAISTACPQLENVVCDTIETAQACVQFLKDNDLDPTTFIDLMKVRESMGDQANRPFNGPEGAPRLFDLVRISDEALRPAFYFALRDTLVAKDLAQATRIGLNGAHRFRVVTLKGELIETVGTMSGGGTKALRGRMGHNVAAAAANESFSADQIAELDRNLATRSNRYDQLQQRCTGLEHDLERIERDLQQMQPLLERSRIEERGLIDQVETLTSQIQKQQKVAKETTVDNEKSERLKANLAGLESTYEDAAKEAATVENAVEKLNNEIKAVNDRLVGGTEKKLKDTKKQLDEAHKNIAKASVATKNAERMTRKAEDKIREMEDEIEANKAEMARLEEQTQKLEADAAEIVTSHEKLKNDLTNIVEEIAKQKEDVLKLENAEQKINGDFIEQKSRMDSAEKKIKELRQKRSYWEHELAKLELHQIEDLSADRLTKLCEAGKLTSDDVVYEEQEMLIILTPAELDAADIDQLKAALTFAEARLNELKPNMNVIEEYKKKIAQYVERVKVLEEITSRRDRHRQVHDQLRKQRLEEFLAGYTMISQKLKEMYQMITLGGDAELELVDSLDPFAEGIVFRIGIMNVVNNCFSVRPPKKSWKQISNLSGGEKTLSSLALVFALHHYKPTPLYVMDEIDAALDFKNVSIVANYIKERTKNAQFIIISLRNNMFELANRLVGIYKTHHCTKSVVVDPCSLSGITTAASSSVDGAELPSTAPPLSSQPSSSAAISSAV